MSDTGFEISALLYSYHVFRAVVDKGEKNKLVGCFRWLIVIVVLTLNIMISMDFVTRKYRAYERASVLLVNFLLFTLSLLGF